MTCSARAARNRHTVLVDDAARGGMWRCRREEQASCEEDDQAMHEDTYGKAWLRRSATNGGIWMHVKPTGMQPAPSPLFIMMASAGGAMIAA
jgi:hypothetical protein